MNQSIFVLTIMTIFYLPLTFVTVSNCSLNLPALATYVYSTCLLTFPPMLDCLRDASL